MHEFQLILTLTGSLTAALVFGYLTQRCGLSPIVGYLLAGIAIGPHTPGFVADKGMAEQFAEIGVILLMFGVGLQFHFKELLDVRRIAIPGAVCQSIAATLLGCLVVRATGWEWSTGIIFGLAISVASTVVLLRVLVDNNELHTPAGHIAVGWLVVEDLFTVFLLVVLPALFAGGTPQAGNLAIALLTSTGKIALLIVLVFYTGKHLIPSFLDRIAATHSRELFTLAVLVIALGIAVSSTLIFGVSIALGAFLAGMAVRQSEFSLRAASEALPMRDAFAVLFFVSAGMLFNPSQVIQTPGLVAATLAIIIFGKPLAALAIVLILGYSPRIAFVVAIALAQIGEFSFILATIGRKLGILNESGFNILIAAAIISISLNPLYYRMIAPLEKWVGSSRIWQFFERRAGATGTHDSNRLAGPPDSSKDLAVVVGFGPTGRTVARLLEENGIEPAIVELNLDTFRELRKAGISSVYGDATRYETLKEVGIERAVAMILSSAGMHGSEEMIRQARVMNPELHIIARTVHLRDIPVLRKAGADAVFSGEGEVALNMTELILQELGATPEQIERERERIRTEFSALPAVPGRYGGTANGIDHTNG